ncbi:MAG: Hsp20/alpha crystallin family protein [Salinisphaera sp.]|jgi:HSP20 family protein|nr:Hsp20/alpha crystallin family protein [Salinisphaera sp.]
MFEDLWRFATPQFGGRDWLREILDDAFQDLGASDIRAVPRGTFPMVNLGATDDAVYVYVFAPGVDPKALDISIQDNILTLRGERRLPEKGTETEQWPVFHRRERVGGQFSRVLTLPEGVDGEATEALSRNGVIQIKLPKREEQRRRKIEVKAQ